MPVASCAKLVSYTPNPCAPSPGGISKLAIGSPNLWDFTQASPVSGVVQPYTAITDLGTSSTLFNVQFGRNTAEYAVTQKNTNGINPSYEHKVTFSVPGLNMLMSQWAQLVDKAGYCCGVLIVMILNDGTINIMGEASVNTNPLTPIFATWMDGSKGQSGKKFDDLNTFDATLTGMYNRPLIQYTGTPTSILSLIV